MWPETWRRTLRATVTRGDALFGLEVAVDDVEAVQMVEREHELGHVEAHVLLVEHDLLGEAREEVAAAHKLEDEVQLALRLEGCPLPARRRDAP